MNSQIAVTSRRLAAILAVFGTLFTVGGTLTLAEHYAHPDAGARIWVEGTGARIWVEGTSLRKMA